MIVSIYGNPMAADADGSLSLGWKETVFLAFAMSIDSLVAGTMAAFLDIPAGLTLLLSFLVGMCMMYAGLCWAPRLPPGGNATCPGSAGSFS